MSKGKCSNHQAQSLSALFSSTNQEEIPQGKSIDDDSETLESLEKGDSCIDKDETVMQGSDVENHNWVDRKMLKAFGSLLLNSEGSARIDIMIQFGREQQNSLPLSIAYLEAH